MSSIADRALAFATAKHQGKKRRNGEEFIVHPIAVGEHIKRYKSDECFDELIAAGYLHDILEETDVTYVELVNTFGYLIAGMVLELTTDEDMKTDLGKEKYLSYRFKNMTSWALSIKLCDRLHNTSDLTILDDDFKDRYIEETENILDFLEKNRELTNTQMAIISEIRKNIENIK